MDLLFQKTIIKNVDFAKLFKNMDVNYCQYKPEIVQIERNGTRSKIKGKFPWFLAS